MKRILCASVTLPLLLAGCESSLAPTVADIRGTYEGDWTITVSNVTEGITLSSTCPGSVSLAAEGASATSFTGAYTILAEEDCSAGSPVTGTVADGNFRPVDGGISFSMSAPEANTNVFEDIFPGSRVPAGALFVGDCVITKADSHMIGSVTGTSMAAEIGADVTCTRMVGDEEVEEFLVVIVDFTGNRVQG